MSKKKVVKKKKKQQTTSPTNSAVNRLIESNLELKHKMTDVLIGVKDLNENVSKMLHLFQSAGEHIKSGKYEDPMISRLNELLEQNKNLVKALSMLEDYVKKGRQQTPLQQKNPLEHRSY